MFYPTVQSLHSYWAYLVLFILLLSSLNALVSYFGKKEFSPRDFRLSLFTLIVTHIQLLIGLVLYFVSPLGASAISENGMAEVMGNSALRLYVVEHPVAMLITITLVTIGYSKHKKKLTSTPKFKMLAIFYTLALLVMLTRIPWANWF